MLDCSLARFFFPQFYLGIISMSEDTIKKTHRSLVCDAFFYRGKAAVSAYIVGYGRMMVPQENIGWTISNLLALYVEIFLQSVSVLWYNNKLRYVILL